MNRRELMVPLFVMLLLVSSGCRKKGSVPDEPEPAGRMALDLTFPSGWRWEEAQTRSQTLERHIVAELWNGNVRAGRQEWSAEAASGDAFVEFDGLLPSATYRVVVWSDLRTDGGTGAYDTSSLLRVKTTGSAGETDMRECCSATATVTTRGENLTTLHLSLTRPVGRWRLICENESEMLAWLKTLSPSGAPYQVTVRYDSPVITVYDAADALGTTLTSGVTVSGRFEPLGMAGVQSAILSDWLLVEPEGETIPATLAFCDRAGNPLVAQEGMALSLRPGHALTLRVRVQNNGIGTGLSVDTEWEGEDIITL